MQSWISVKGVVRRGHGVASGRSGDPRFPSGTLAMQKPFFKALGLDLNPYYLGTVNVSIAPQQYEVRDSKYTFKDVQWSPIMPAEDFSFFDCRIITTSNQRISGLIYYPHPETKPEHFQSADILEVIMPYIKSLKYGDELLLEVDSQQIHIF